jgi:hypothetical protein
MLYERAGVRRTTSNKSRQETSEVKAMTDWHLREDDIWSAEGNCRVVALITRTRLEEGDG